MNIGNKLFLAPMHNVNCIAFRLLCKKNGADIVSTPMINVKSFINNPDKFKWIKKERPLSVQLIGNDSNDFKECAQTIDNCDFIDLNAGCPSNDNVINNCGAALLKDLKNFEKIIKTLKKYSKVPVSVKIRSGWKKDESAKILKIAQKAGADFLAIHPRTKFEGYDAAADWNIIKKIRELANIPIIANGDIDSPIAAEKCLKITNADALMIGREAIKNPFIFNDIKNYLKKGKINRHLKEEKINLIIDFIKLYKKHDEFNFFELKNHCIWLCHGIKGAAKARNIIGKSKNENEIKKIIQIL